MQTNELVRPSRDGDQFHYLRGARLCLELLSPKGELMAVTIEGVPLDEDIAAGLDSIDLALYYGSSDIQHASQIHYRQFKHSTLQSEKEWTASGLKKSLADFAARYLELVSRFGRENVAKRFTFGFETNRPIASDVSDSIKDIIDGGTSHASDYFRGAIGLQDEDLRHFASLVQLFPQAGDYQVQRSLLQGDLASYLPDADRDAPIKLKDLVARKATSEFTSNPSISREDVLKAIDADARDLFPAPPVFDSVSDFVEREQMRAIVSTILNATKPILLTADGGVGKSVLATRLGGYMPDGSEAFTYDCFGNGGYRSPSGYRHRPRDGLVQLSNEMATAGLCDPLIATGKAEASAFIRAFLGRVGQASAALMARSSNAILLVVIDAADNAQMASDEAQDGPSFPKLLLRERFPANVRMVFSSRPHRVELLNPPPDIQRIQLAPFTEQESKRHLFYHFSDASDQDAREFHRLTSHNPRVQKAAINAATDLPGVLAALGPIPRSVDDTIGSLLETAIASVRDAVSVIEKVQVDRLCEALATLRPFVPIDVIAAAANVPTELVRSIASDLGRPLLIRDDAVQFRDEPTETWFQQRFRPHGAALEEFVSRLAPLASTSIYVAAALPQLMLQAGQLDALMTLALSDHALPVDNPIARRDVEMQRLQFALKAALRSKRYADAARLALKAGGEAAADGRQQSLLSSNTDLAARFLSAEQLIEQVSRRLIVGGQWTGSKHAYEAALLSGKKGLAGDARSRLRIAYDWLRHWSRERYDDEHRRPRVTDTDIAELNLAELNLHGADACAAQLRRWRPREISFRVGLLLVDRLLDSGRFDDIDALALSAGNDISLVLAILVRLDEVGRVPPRLAVERTLRIAGSSRVQLRMSDDWRGAGIRLDAVNALILAATHYRLAARRDLARILARYLPKNPPATLSSEHAREDRYAHLRAYHLRKRLCGSICTLDSLAPRTLRKELKRLNQHDSDVRRFQETVAVLAPWHQLGVEARLGRVEPAELSERIEQALDASGNSRDYSERAYSPTIDEIARIFGDLILRSSSPDGLWAKFFDWSDGLKTPLSFPSLVALSRRASLHPGQQHVAIKLAERALKRIAGERESAESKAESYVSLTRAILLTSIDEARQYFEDAIVVSSKIGEENLNRWDALLYMADASVSESTDEPAVAYRLSRAAELTYAYVMRDKHFDWPHTMEAIAKLSCSSSLAILSRWTDRRFGYEDRLLPRLAEGLALRNVTDRRDLMPLIAFMGRWDYSAFLETACETADSSAERQNSVSAMMRYLQFSALSPYEWRRIKDIFARWQVSSNEIDGMLERAERVKADDNDNGTSRQLDSLEKEDVDWDMVFSGADLTDPVAIKVSIERFRTVDRYFRRGEFLLQAVMRITPGRELAFIDAYGVAKMPNLHDLADFLTAIPGEWFSRVSVRPALARLVKSVCRRCAGSLSVDRDYQPLPADLVSRTAGLGQADMIAEALESFASATLPVSSGGLFRLVGLLSKVMGQGDALKTLRFGLDLLEPVLEPDEGDGEWCPALEPPKALHDALAGYLWAALGSPIVGRRWQAAHAVRLAAKLERTAILDALVRFATKGGDEPFWDQRLRPYRLHSLQWLLIAFDRSSRESGPTIGRYLGFLNAHARRENRHVLLRGLSARALVSLASQDVIQLSSEEIERLRGINASLIPHVESKTYARATDAPHQLDAPKQKFLVGYDFGKSEVSQLARAFGIHQDGVEQQIESVIWDDWGLEENGHWDSDARAVRGFFRENFRRNNGDSDRQDSLSSYLSYHALMETAGKLLETVALHEDTDDDWSSFRRWLSRRDLARSDGTWLVDLRDLTPVDCLELPAEDERNWPDSMTAETAARAIHPTSDAVVVAGQWTQYSARRMQTVGIRTALSCGERSAALARALASTQVPWVCGLPSLDSDDEIHHDEFVLDGWIREIQSVDDDGVGDPWAAGLDPSPFEIDSTLASSLGLTAATTGRAWVDATGNLVLWNESWSDGEDRDEAQAASGKRLVVKRSFLDHLVAVANKALIFEVNAKREIVYRHYETDRGESRGPEVKAIIRLSEKSGLEFTRSGDGARPKTRRRTKARRIA
jgi:hypothetical protein